MPDVPMTPYTGNLLEVAFRAGNSDRLDHRLMAVSARFLSNAAVPLGYLYRFVKGIRRKVIGMPETIRRLRVVFADEVMRRVTIVAGGDRMVARFLPAVKLLVHHVAICTRSGIIAQVGITLRVNERVHAYARGQPDSDSDDHKLKEPK